MRKKISKRILAGDIGGTKTVLRAVDVIDDHHQVIAEHCFPSADYSDLTLLVNAFLLSEKLAGTIVAAGFGVAGPVTAAVDGQVSKITNLPWTVASAELARDLRIPKVRLINDFEAIGDGIEALSADDLVVLQAGVPVPHGPCAVIGAGTGLGQALLVWHTDHYEAIPTEGGHVDFAPTDDQQTRLFKYICARHDRVSYGRVLSGPGLVLIYEFLRNGTAPTAISSTDDPAAAISRAALDRTDPAAVEALAIFVRIYGSQAGNLALASGATGGVYIAGGIAPKISSVLAKGTFLEAFTAKGRMAPLLARVPVRIIMNPLVGLLGAQCVASRL